MRETTRLKVFDIELLGDQEVYHLGDSISGALLIEPFNGQTIAKIRVGIHAVAKVSWLMGSAKNHNTRSSIHRQDSSKQVVHAIHYFDAERPVYENRRASCPSGPDLNGLSKMRATSRLGLLGPEEFPFVFKLPERGAPASWNGLYGSVRYWIEAVVEVGGKDCFREDVQQTIIIAPSIDVTLPNPQIQSQKFPISGLACVTSSLSASLELSQATYSLGDPIHVRVFVKNVSPWKVFFRLSLKNTQIFVGKNNLQKIIKDELTTVQSDVRGGDVRGGDVIRANSDAQWTSTLTVPATAVASLLDCSIMKCHYTVTLRLRVRSVISQLFEVSVPIFVLRSRLQTEELRTLPESENTNRDLESVNSRSPQATALDLAETSSVK